MSRLASLFMLTLLLAACSGPKDTPVPKDLSAMESVKPSIEKLSAEEKELFAG